MSFTAASSATIVLAAGLSRRMGARNKLLLEVDGYSLLRRSVSAALEAGVGEVVVVLGHESERTRLEIDNLPVRFVVNPDYESGQMSSVQCGLDAVGEGFDAIIICLADQPLITAIHINMLTQAFGELPADKSVVVPVFKEQRGNPVMISDHVRLQVLRSGANPGCRKYIDNHPESVHWLTVTDEAFISDVDTPDDFVALFGQLKMAQRDSVPGDHT